MHYLRTLSVAGAIGLAGVSASAIAAPAFTITAGLYFQALNSPNYFDPSKGYVPPGSGNVAGISKSVPAGTYGDIVNFRYDDKANLDTLQLILASDSLFVLRIEDRTASSAYGFYMVLDASRPIFSQPRSMGDGFGGQIVISGGGRSLIFYAPPVNDARGRIAQYTFVPPVNPAARPSSTSLANMSPVPEPATWLTMTIGFGLIGATLRTSRRRVRIPIA